jgi:hypothetical protein
LRASASNSAQKVIPGLRRLAIVASLGAAAGSSDSKLSQLEIERGWVTPVQGRRERVRGRKSNFEKTVMAMVAAAIKLPED